MATDYGSPDIVLTALSTIMPTGTTIARVLIKKGIQSLGGTFPVLILNVPQSSRKTVELQAKQMTCTVEGIYLDLWTSSQSRTIEQAGQDALDALNNAAINIEGNQQLVVAGSANCLRAGGNMTVFVDKPLQNAGLGYPNIYGRITVDILGLIYNL